MVAMVAETLVAVVAVMAVAALPQLNGRGDHQSNYRDQVSAAAATISAATIWMPWLKYRRLEGLF